MKKHLFKIIQSLFLIVICFASGVVVQNSGFVSTSADLENIPTVIIDPGHGGLTNTIKV